MFPVEIVYQIEESQYKIVEHFFSTFECEIQGFLIFDKINEKYNGYIVGYIGSKFPIFPEDIIKKYCKIDIESAVLYFPQYKLSENNYGF